MAAVKQLAFFMLIPIACGYVQGSGCYSTQCTPGWVIFRDHCYKFSPPNELTLTFDEAEDYCQRFSNPNGEGHLVSVHDQQESDFVFSLAQAAGMVGDVWIGLTDKQTEGVFKWTDNSSVSYYNWRTSEPSSGYLSDTNEDYTEMIYDGTWNDANGDSGLMQSFMCKMPSYDLNSFIGKACFNRIQ